MTEEIEVSDAEVDQLYQKLSKDAQPCGYYLNPDVEFTKSLVSGLIVNERRYGYQNCPCRLATGKKEDDLDIICPCDYRDADVVEYGACYCGLYVSQKAAAGEQPIKSIPERRRAAASPAERDKSAQRKKPQSEFPIPNSTLRTPQSAFGNPWSLPLPVWRCKVCGYLTAREHPPDICPICKAKRDRFERFI